MEPATETALLVAHGQPSSPERPERELATRAAQVEALLPGWTVGSSTLAASGALDAAIARLEGRPLVYPVFMTNGWFVSVNLRQRLARAGAAEYPVLPPLGLDPGLPGRILARLERECRARGLSPGTTPLLVAAHGSPSDPRPRRVTEALAGVIRRDSAFSTVVTGYVDEAPYLSEAAREALHGLCLPFFASSNSHVAEDLPEALDAADYGGVCLPPVGEWNEVPAMIAAALARASPGARGAPEAAAAR